MPVLPVLVVPMAQPVSGLPSAAGAFPLLMEQALHIPVGTNPSPPPSQLGHSQPASRRSYTHEGIQGHPLCGHLGSFSKNGS